MAEPITSFGSEIGDMILHSRVDVAIAKNAVQRKLLNSVAEMVIDEGGLCDDKTFMTAFYGGLAVDLQAGHEVDEDHGANVPETARRALTLGNQLGYAALEPYDWDGRDRHHASSVRLVLPQEGDPRNVKFSIEATGKKRTFDREYVGTVSFRGLGLKYPFEDDRRDVVVVEQKLLRVERGSDSDFAGYAVGPKNSPLVIGRPGLRRLLNPGGTNTNDGREAELDRHVDDLLERYDKIVDLGGGELKPGMTLSSSPLTTQRKLELRYLYELDDMLSRATDKD